MREFGSNPADAHLRKLMEDPRYWRDREPAYVAMIQQGFKDLYDNPSPQARAAEGAAANEMGMNGQRHAQDSMVAHVTPGEIVIPLSAQTPELIQYLNQTLGQDLLKYVVGSGYEQANPTSGLPAFAGPYRSLKEVDRDISDRLADLAKAKLELRNTKSETRRNTLEFMIKQLNRRLEELHRERKEILENTRTA